MPYPHLILPLLLLASEAVPAAGQDNPQGPSATQHRTVPQQNLREPAENQNQQTQPTLVPPPTTGLRDQFRGLRDLPPDLNGPYPQLPQMPTPSDVGPKHEADTPPPEPPPTPEKKLPIPRPFDFGDQTKIKAQPEPDWGQIVVLDCAGAFAGGLGSLMILGVLGKFVLNLRPEADRPRRWAVPLIGLGYSAHQARFHERQLQHLGMSPEEEREERQRLTQPSYAIQEGYISDRDFRKLQKSYLAASELAFGLLFPAVALVFSLGLQQWLSRPWIAIWSAFLTCALILMSIERYHKYRSAFKTIVLANFYRARTKGAGGPSAEVQV